MPSRNTKGLGQPFVTPWMGNSNPPTTKAKRAQHCRCGSKVTITDEVGVRCAVCGKAPR